MDLIVKMIFGAPLYGTATPKSDIDYKGVFLPSRGEILLGRIPKCRRFATGDNHCKNRPGDVDEDLYSLHHFIALACQGEIVAMDMLHAPSNVWIVATEVWKEIIRHRQRFYSKNLMTFLAYARRQTAKYGIQGSRLHAAATLLEVLKQKDPKLRLVHVWSDLPRMDHCGEADPDPNGIRQYQVCGKTFQATVAIGQVIPVVQKFLETFGQRARLAADNKAIDWKAVSHAMRAAIQTREIVVNGEIVYPLRDAAYLQEIKAGRLDYYKEVAPALEKMMADVARLIQRSNLPDQPDRQFWDDFICRTVETYRFGIQ